MAARKHLTVTDVVVRSIAEARTRLSEQAPQLLATADDDGADAHAVHQARVATRRLRSDLRTFEPWLDEEWAEHLRAELRWLGSELGEVRDLDVMRSRLRADLTAIPAANVDAADRVLHRLDADRAAARATLRDMMREPRYTALVEAIELATTHPQLAPNARRAARAELRAPVRDRWRKLRRAVDGLGEQPRDEALHEVRIRAKRVRYAAEAVTPVFGKPSRRFAARAAVVQEVLGDQHDAVVAAAWIAKTAEECTPAEAYALGMLAELQRVHAHEGRAAFRAVWKRARKPKLRRWL
jgi:CHAD domain-containing protein